MRKDEGMALISVLMILLMITALGVVAMRFGLTGLQLATNSQAQSLMFQASDSGLNEVDKVAGTPSALFSAESSVGFIGYPKIAKGKELVFCYRPKTGNFFDITKASEITYLTASTVTSGGLGSGGFCSSANSDDYTSDRNAVMTQVTVIATVDNTSLQNSPFSGYALGTDVDAEVPMQLRIYTTSVIPALATASSTVMDDCLSKHVSDIENAKVAVGDTTIGANDDVAGCLTSNNIPFNMQVKEYVSGADHTVAP